MSDQPTVYATVERRTNLGRFEHETVTIGVSKIPVTSSDDFIRMAVRTGERCVQLIREELAQIINDRFNDSVLEPHPPACHFCGVIGDCDCQSPNPAVVEPDDLVECPEHEVLHDPQEPCPACPIPSEDEIHTHVTAFGVTVELPDITQMMEPISEVNADGTGGGQMRALNTVLGEYKLVKKDRHWACLVLLQQMFGAMARTEINSLRDLTKYEASVLLSWFSFANEITVSMLRDATSKAKGQLEVVV
jgi:hypothetical protein